MESPKKELSQKEQILELIALFVGAAVLIGSFLKVVFL